MNRRSFVSRVVATVTAFFALRSVAEPAEPACAWCSGTGERLYSQYPFDGTAPHRLGICDACRQDERRPERVRWLMAERDDCLAKIAELKALRVRRPDAVIMCGCADLLTCEHPWPAIERDWPVFGDAFYEGQA